MDSSTTSDLALAGLVHDLNNVFETISEAAELVADDPEWVSVVAAIQRSVERGRRIVGSYADHTRSAPELEVLIERATTFMNDFLAHMPGVKVKVHSKVPDGLRLAGDSSDWERVFMNLFLNAAQAMKEAGGGVIDVTAQQANDMIDIRVADNGPGIPEEILGKIFSPRFSTKTRQAGLGLHIVRSIVKQCGGVVTAGNSEKGQGAVFTISAPPLASPEPAS